MKKKRVKYLSQEVDYLQIKISNKDKAEIMAFASSRGFCNISEFVRVTLLALCRKEIKYPLTSGSPDKV
jgi:hypothetical protein